MRHQRPSPNEEVLKSVDLAQLAGATPKIEVVADHQIQLSGFPGRDLLIQIATQDKPDEKVEMHVRFYVVGNILYQLTYAGFGDSSPDTEARFLNSFTRNMPSTHPFQGME